MRHNSTLRKTVARLLAIGLMIGVCVLIIQAAVSNDDISSKVGVNNLGVAYSFDDGRTSSIVNNGAKFTPSPSSKTIGLTVKSYSAWSSNNCTPGNLTLTLTNNYDSKAELSFDYTVSQTYGTWTVGTEKGVMSRTGFLVTLDGHAEFTITISSTRSSKGASGGVVMNITNIQLVEQVFNVDTTFLSPEQGGNYSVDGVAITSEKIITNKSNYLYNLAATPATGYVFAGWKNTDTGAYFSGDASISRAFTENSRIKPVFVPEGSAQFGVGSQKFYNLNVANEYAVTNDKSKIVLLQSGPLLAENYEISKGVTLLIPYDQSGMENETTHEATPATVDSANSNRTAFRTLTIPSGATLTVNGAINVDGQVLSNGSIPTGPYGLITLHRGSAIVLNDGGKLYCWGYINGDGVVSANANSAVYECFQLAGWRGGSDSLNMNNNRQKVFPVNQYYVQNVEARLEFNYGAAEYVFASVTVNVKVATAYASTTEVYIGKDKGMFRPDKEGSVLTKKYVPATDRTEFEVKGDMTINTMTLDLVPKLGSVSFSAFAVKLATGSYVLPINSGFSVNIYSGTTTIAKDQDIALLPGAEFTVSEGAEFVAASNMYVYDHDQWAGQKYAYGFYGYGACDLAPVGYSTTNGTSVIRSADKEGCLKDAVIDVNGKMTIKGNIYTTSCDNNVPGVPDTAKGQVSCGAYIFSTGGNGVVVFNNKYPDTIPTTHQYQQASKTYSDIACNPAWLRNGDGTYTETAGAQAGWTYKYDTVQQRWYRFRVNYQFNGKDIGYDLITTDTTTRDVSNYVSDNSSLVGRVTSGTANTPTISGGTLTVTGVGSDCTINIEGVAASYTPYFVLNEHQYGVYRSYGGAEIAQKAEIGGKTYYVVKACGTLEFGSALEAPSNEAMGVSEDNHNSITWFLEDVTTGAQQFMGTVPSGTTKGKPVYIYGIYNGAVAHNSYTDKYYTNLKDAIVDLPVTGSATLTMYANCGTFEDESKTASYSLSANITFDVNGKEAWGSLVNNGTLTLDLNGGSVRYITGATAGSSTYRGAATIVNNGTMTIQGSKGGGVISTDAVCDDNVRYDLKNHTSAIRNLGKLTMEGVSVAVDQSVNDWATAVMNYDGGVITSINNCSVVCKRGYGITNYGGTIQTISGGTINGGDAATAGRYGIQNRNIRSGSQTDAAPFVISKLGTIDTISDVTVYVYQYGLINYATVNRITGNTNITTTADSAIRNQAGWYYDTQVTKGTTTEANNVKTTVYTYDTVNFPTIKEISGNVTVTANGSYAIWNSGNIEKISGDMNGNGVLITRPNGNYTLENSGYIGEISGKVTIYSSGAYVLMQNIWGSTNSRQIGRTYIQRDVGGDGDYTSVGDIREYTDEYTAPVIDKIGGENSEVTISGTSSVLYNYGTINTIADGVTVTARTGSSAVINGSGGQQTVHSVRTNLGKFKFLEKDAETKEDKEAERYETRIEDERTYYRAKIGSISSINGDITIQSLESSGALVNGGTIDSIGSGVKLQAKSSALQNNSYTFEQQQYVYLGYSKTSVFGASNEAGRDYAYTATAPVITLIDGPTIQTTSGDQAIANGGTIGTIQNATISAKGAYAINNSSNIITERKIYKDKTHTTAYALAELFDAFFKKDAATGKYTSVAASATPNRVDSYGAIPTITLIGADNNISATKQTIYNRGEITNIDSGSATKTSITATDQDTSGQAIYNLSALAGTKTFTDGSSGVDGDYKTPAHIGTIRNVNVTAEYRAIQNGNDGSYLNVIDEIGVGAQVTSNTNGEAVYNANKNAQIKSIKNGTYTAATADHYAVYNDGTTYAITIEGGYFKGGLSSTANRDHAIYQPDEPKRQTYHPKGYTLSSKPNEDGYYYIAENKFTIRYDSNGSTSDPVTGSVADQEFTLPQSNVALRSNSYTRENWDFVGWALNENTGAGTVEKLLSGKVTLDKLGNPGAGDKVTLYAIWKPNKSHSVTVSWNSDKLLYNYQPNVYEWDATNLCYVLKTPAYWKGDHIVTITNTGEVNNTKYGKVNVGISYTNTNTSYSGFSMKYYNPDTQVEFTGTDSRNNLAKALDPGGIVKAQMKLIGDLPTGMASGTNIKIGRVTLTLTTAD